MQSEEKKYNTGLVLRIKCKKEPTLYTHCVHI